MDGNVVALAFLFFLVFHHLGRIEDQLKKSK
jgi:hypothetical protein